MNRIGTLLLLALSVSALDAQALEARQTPYDKIAERNVFQLHAAPILKEPQITPPPLRKVTLTGITILEKRLAYITIEAIKSQPSESVTIPEGESVKEIRVQSIDERAGVVRILNGGELQILNFEPEKPVKLPPNQVPMTMQLPAPSAQIRPEPSLTPEEQTALIELQRITLQREGNPAHTLLPPTELHPNL